MPSTSPTAETKRRYLRENYTLETLPWHVVSGVLTTKVSGAQANSPQIHGIRFTVREIRRFIEDNTPKTRNPMTIILHDNKYHLRNKDGDIHSTRYPTRERAADAARKISAGLAHWQSLVKRVTSAHNHTNAL